MKKLAAFILIICGAGSGCDGAADPADSERLAVANAMVAAWNSRDWDAVYALFADDGVLHSVMIEPIVGREAIRERLAPMLAGVERIELQIANIGTVGDVVMLERVDDFVYKGRHSRIPVVGVMEISNGKVDEWREYYDKASLAAALAAEATDSDPAVELRELTTQLSVDWNAGRMSDYLDAYSDEAGVSMNFGDRSLRSKDDIVELFTASWTTEEAMGDFETADLDVRIVAPGIAVVNGAFEHRFPAETINGAFSHVWQKNASGDWRIIHEHTSRRSGE